jgi:hypothetical protein
MNEENLHEKFHEKLDLILKDDLAGLENEEAENSELLLFVHQIKQIDYSSESKTREVLKERLLKKIQEAEINKADGELNDEELDCAAGGLFEFPDNDDQKK